MTWDPAANLTIRAYRDLSVWLWPRRYVGKHRKPRHP